MSNLKVPYEISLWEERLVAVDASGNEYDDFIDTSITVDHQYYKEKKICIIGSHTMETPIAAVDPVLVQKVDGTSTLTFSIYSKYYDETSGELLDNPFVKYLTNERKVKLKYFPKNDNQAEWLDLVIKKISETSESYKFSYTATDSFINELSKTGYNLVFDAELNNNTGSVNDLAAAILEGTDWTVDETAGQLQETIEEPMYELVLTKDITAWKIEDTSQTNSITIKAGSKIYPFYSCVKNSTADFYQFIYLDGADPLVDQDGILRNEGCQYFIKAIPSGTATYFNEYRAERYARTAKIKYEKELERYVQGYTSRYSNDVWGYVENETMSPTIIKNYLVNSENIISTKGWIHNYPDLVGIETFPTVKNAPAASARLRVLKTATVDDKNVSDNGKAQALINSGLVSNAYDIKKIVAGDKYVFRLKVGSDWNKSTSTPALTGTDSAMKFKVFIGKKKVTKGSDNIPTKTVLEDDGALGVGNWGVSLANATQLSDGSYYTVVTFQKSYDEEELKKLYLSLKLSDINDKTQYYIEFAQFFPYTEFVDSNTRFMPLPNLEMVRLEDYSIHNFSDLYVKLEPVYYFYYYDKDGNKIERSAKNTSGYAPVYVPNYGKVRSITAKESNRFNLLQDLSESFECWCKFTIEHEENGAIKLGDKHKPLKKVSFHAQVGQKKNIGFVYGKNLKSISRTLDSDSIASKLIVKSNANKLAESGSCNIARAAQNPSGENFVYDFSHYIKQGLLNKYNVYNDLYDDNASKGYVGLFPQLKQKNLERDKLIQQSAILVGDYSEYKAQANADELLLEKSRDILFDLETEFVEKTGKSFDALEDNDQLLEKDEFLGIATSISLYRQQIEDLEQKINGNSGSKKRLEEIESELKVLSGQLSNIEAETSDLIHKFENKYSRFIQEASWTSEDYIDDNLYYIDAESTLHESAQPKVTYTINVVDLSQLDEYKPYRFELGDITYIQDTDFFGWQLVDGVKTPYKEEIVVTELTTNFHEPDKATIKVRNYKNQFEDLFQRLTASTQQLKFHSGEYDRSADVVNGKGMVQPGALQEAFNNNAYTISNINNQSVEMGEQGIIIRNTRAPNEIVRLASGGIFLTEDGGETWTTGIMASGINAKVITTGTLNAALANITTGNDGGGVFIDENGITGKDSDKNERFRLSNAGEFKVGNDTNYVKFNENQSGKLDIKADSFSLTSGSIGGQNLLKNTAFELGENGLKHWTLVRTNNTNWQTERPVEDDVKALKLWSIQGKATSSRSFYQEITGIKREKQYTISGDVLGNLVGTKIDPNSSVTDLFSRGIRFRLYSQLNGSNLSANVIASTENYSLQSGWNHFSLTFKEKIPSNFDKSSAVLLASVIVSNTEEQDFRNGPEEEYFYFQHLKLEEGSIATGWTENGYEGYSKIEQTANSITQQVEGMVNADYYGENNNQEDRESKEYKNITITYPVIVNNDYAPVFQDGIVLAATFDYDNKNKGAIRLNITTASDETPPGSGNYGYPIYYSGVITSDSNPFLWTAGSTIHFRFTKTGTDTKSGLNTGYWSVIDPYGVGRLVTDTQGITGDAIDRGDDGFRFQLRNDSFKVGPITDGGFNPVLTVGKTGLQVNGNITAQTLRLEGDSKEVINNLAHIDGRNLLLDTEAKRTTQNNVYTWSLSEFGKQTLRGATRTVRIQFEAKAGTATRVDTYPRYEEKDGSIVVDTTVAKSFPIKTEWERHNVEIVIPNRNWIGWTLRNNASVTGGGGSSNVVVHFRKVKLEFGPNMTDWTIAPEEVPSTYELQNAFEAASRTNYVLQSGNYKRTLTDGNGTITENNWPSKVKANNWNWKTSHDGFLRVNTLGKTSTPQTIIWPLSTKLNKGSTYTCTARVRAANIKLDKFSIGLRDDSGADSKNYGQGNEFVLQKNEWTIISTTATVGSDNVDKLYFTTTWIDYSDNVPSDGINIDFAWVSVVDGEFSPSTWVPSPDDATDYADSVMGQLDTKVINYLSGGGKTTLTDNYVISPYLGGGYLNIGKAGKGRVVINPNSIQEAGNNSIFAVYGTDANKAVIGLDTSGNAFFNGNITANTLTLTDSSKKTINGLIDANETLIKIQSTANSALSTANTANSTANTANSTANTAKNTANAASTAAAAAKTYAESEISKLDSAVAKHLSGGGTTTLGTNYVISPYIGGGYLNIASGSKRVIIDPANLTKNGYIFQVHNGSKVTLGIDSAGNTTMEGKITASTGAIGGWNIGTIPDGKLWGGTNDSIYSGSLYNAATIDGNNYLAFLRIAGSSTGEVFSIRTRPADKTTVATTKFSVARNGDLYAANANITGAIHATSLTLGTAATNTLNTAISNNSTVTGAVSTANTAKSTADTAKSTAETAKSTANTAKSTADTVAANVQNKVDSVVQGSYSWAFSPTTGIGMWDSKAKVLQIDSSGLHVTGEITATGGKIGNWEIGTGIEQINEYTQGSVVTQNGGKKYEYLIKVKNLKITPSGISYGVKLVAGSVVSDRAADYASVQDMEFDLDAKVSTVTNKSFTWTRLCALVSQVKNSK